jgi:dihydrofolate reductase
MRKVILQIDVTLDGFIAGTNGELDWVTSDEVMEQEASELLETADTILLGRVAYQMFAAYWPLADMTAPTTLGKITSQINHATKIVFSRTLERAEWGEWHNARVISGNIVEEITKMKSSSGKNLLLYAGGKIVSTFIENRLIDEYHLRVHPVLLGKGMALFPNAQDRLNLKFIRTRAYDNGAVLLVYQPN